MENKNIDWTYYEIREKYWNSFISDLSCDYRIEGVGFFGDLWDCNKFDEADIYNVLEDLIAGYSQDEEFKYFNQETLEAYIERWCTKVSHEIYEDALRLEKDREEEQEQ